MLRPQLQAPSSNGTTSFVLPQLSNHHFHGSCSASSSLLRLGRPSAAKTGQHKAKPRGIKTVRCVSSKEVQTTTTSKEPSVVSVKGIITVQQSVGGFLSNIGIDRGLDDIKDLFGMSILVEIVSAELDPKTGLEKPTITDYAHKVENDKGVISYQADFTIPRDFGEIGAILIENEHHKEMFVKAIVLTGYGDNPVTFICNSWVHSKYDNPEKRVFFNTKSYLPSQTPRGLKELRKKELTLLRGDGKGERKPWERVYDYDVYNDLGNPDDDNLARPVLGGKEHPYPRRCRTGRPRTEKDPNSESRDGYWYLPRDEEFSELKQTTFSIKTLRSLLHAVVPIIETSLVDPDLRFPYFTAIDKLFNEGVNVPAKEAKLFNGILPRLLKVIGNMNDGILLFETPEMIDRDKFSWFRDEEFSRQTLAGLNPFSIELVREFPFVSKLDPEIYGPPESALTKELIEREIKSVMTVEEALKQKKLFIIDYHDLFLPYVQRVRELDGTTLYGSRTLFFLQPDDTLQLVAIELTRPASPTQPQWKGVFTSCWDATSAWLWKLAKAHVLAHDSGYHQLVSHWLRTHACVEPYIIAANRQLSEMHPIFRLLRPHFRYTMDINNLARQSLINAGGIIETCFSPLKYSIEISSAAYDKLWRFDMEALPADLVKRGMAVEDPTAEHGLRLTIKDYPYACDGLLLWSAIKDWVSDYVCHYYPDDAAVASDDELQSFWLEVRTKGHGDKKDEPWWPVLDSRESLVHVLTTIIWVGSGHHAAANFGQYHFAGYFPNRPTITRRNMPCEEGNEQEFDRFFEKPERALLETFPAQAQATKVMAILDVLSNHSVDEEYIGALDEEDWSGAHNAVIRAAYERFYGRLKEIEGIIDERNTNQKLKNRCGAGVVPYELLKPFSEPGVTGKGVPNSISI